MTDRPRGTWSPASTGHVSAPSEEVAEEVGRNCPNCPTSTAEGGSGSHKARWVIRNVQVRALRARSDIGRNVGTGAHNPEVAGSNPAPATSERDAAQRAASLSHPGLIACR
jgi:hypothetical protein